MGVRTFVETGTYRGDTAAWASEHFERVVTIEFSEPIHAETTRRLGHLGNVEFLFGDSRMQLPRVVATLRGPAMFWLDGHWSGGDTYGEGDECPVLDEIRIVNLCRETPIVCIDDARLFQAPPPPPHDASAWPGYAEVLATLNASHHAYATTLVDDTILAHPESCTVGS